MANLHIPNTTLFSVCWGSEYLRCTLRSIITSLKISTFDDIVLITDCDDEDILKYKDLTSNYGIRLIKRDMPLKENVDDDNSRQTFSEILLKLLNEFCSKDFIMVIQPDSSIISSEKWTDRFFDYDYIGAPWPIEIVKSTDMAHNRISNIPNLVGNGGFSIRSKKYVNLSLNMPVVHKNEDLNLCIFNYDEMAANGIKFAPIDLASQFSIEHPIYGHKIYDRRFLLTYNSFAFHGEFNIAGMKYINQNSKEVI